LLQSFVPGGDSVTSLQAGAFERHLRAEIEGAPLAGAASHVARYTPLVARPG
jgi:hypothetical protein